MWIVDKIVYVRKNMWLGNQERLGKILWSPACIVTWSCYFSSCNQGATLQKSPWVRVYMRVNGDNFDLGNNIQLPVTIRQPMRAHFLFFFLSINLHLVEWKVLFCLKLDDAKLQRAFKLCWELDFNSLPKWMSLSSFS